MRDITLEDTFRHDFSTRAFATGIPTVLAGTPVLSVLEEDNATPITAGVSVSVDRASVVGLNEAAIVATAANGYEAGKSYSIYISTGTVGGVSVVGEVVGHFTIGASAAAVDLANGTDGLGALKTLIDALPAQADITGGAYSLDTDANGRPRIVDGTGVGELDTLSGTVLLRAATQTSIDAIETDTSVTLDNHLTDIKGTGFVKDTHSLVDIEGYVDLIDDGTSGLAKIATDVAVVLTGTPTTKYMGPRGPGVYVDSGAGNTNTVTGTDGTVDNPVSTFVAARTIADAIGLTRYYLEGNSDATLAATHVDWEFMGLGSVEDNVVNLGSQDVSRSVFVNLTIEGTQGGSGRIEAIECALQDPGAGATTLHIFAFRCGLMDEIEVDTSNNNVFDSCYSLVEGSGTPKIIATGAAGTIGIRHYSGGIELSTLSASHNVSIEGMGQVIFTSDCNVNANVSIRGLFTITDNTAGMVSLTEDAVVNMPKINTEIDTALSDYDGPTNAEMVARTLVAASYFDPAVDAVATVTTLTNLPAITADWLTAAGLATDAVNEIRDAITGFAGSLDTDANGRMRVVDGTGAGELDTLSGTVLLRAATEAQIDAIETALGTAGDGLTAIPWNAAWDAEVQSECADALVAHGTTAVPESYAANGVAPTWNQFMYATHQKLMQGEYSGTASNVYKLDNIALAFAGTLDDATNPTEDRRV